MLYRSLFVLLAIVLSFLLKFTDSDYPFGVYLQTLFIENRRAIKNGQQRAHETFKTKKMTTQKTKNNLATWSPPILFWVPFYN